MRIFRQLRTSVVRENAYMEAETLDPCARSPNKLIGGIGMDCDLFPIEQKLYDRLNEKAKECYRKARNVGTANLEGSTPSETQAKLGNVPTGTGDIQRGNDPKSNVFWTKEFKRVL